MGRDKRNRTPGKKVQKHPFRLIRDCETHLFFLWEANERYSLEPERIKQISATLRVLVCKTRRNKPLLLNLMDKYGLDYKIHPEDGVPWDVYPIWTVDQDSDPEMQRFSAELAAIGGIHSPDIDDFKEKWKHLRRALPLRKYIERGCAGYVQGTQMTHQDIILMTAHQSGAHEDEEIDYELATMESFYVGGMQSNARVILA